MKDQVEELQADGNYRVALAFVRKAEEERGSGGSGGSGTGWGVFVGRWGGEGQKSGMWVCLDFFLAGEGYPTWGGSADFDTYLCVKMGGSLKHESRVFLLLNQSEKGTLQQKDTSMLSDGFRWDWW